MGKGKGGEWSLGCCLLLGLLASTAKQCTHNGAGAESSPDSGAVQQLLHVVEGLEEELFSSEARRNDAEVCNSTSCMDAS